MASSSASANFDDFIVSTFFVKSLDRTLTWSAFRAAGSQAIQRAVASHPRTREPISLADSVAICAVF